MIRRRILIGVGLFVALIVGYFGVTFVQVWMASRQDGAQPAGAIIVLGAAQYNGRPSPVLQARLDHAVELYEEEIAPIIVLTGGNRPGDRYTEAYAGSVYLRKAGVPGDALRLETGGHNSWQSLAAAARFLRDEGVEEVVLVTSPYHALRVVHIADEVGLDGHASPADDAPDKATLGHLTHETLAVGLGRIIGYRHLIDLNDRVGRVRGGSNGR